VRVPECLAAGQEDQAIVRRNRRTVIRGSSWSQAAVGVLRFELRAVLVTILASALILTTSPMATPAVHAATPRVVIIVGPVGSLTDNYRADGEKAAKAARAAGATVETIYSPNATWPVVRDALQGASLVVYLGHGNGWPSRYRKSPAPKTQNGLGLNPEAGVDDKAHQYFGEAYLARDVRLAPNAVVVLSHLCYASGNSEPGLPEGDLATGQQRVDNFAAGWLAAGADAVLAEGFGGPAYYVRQILEGDGTIESIWRKAPTAHGHVLAFPSVRTPGMTALMDPTHESSGFYRSLVARAEMRADEVARGAAGAKPRGVTPATTVAVPAGPVVTDVALDGVPTVASTLRVTLKVDKASRKAARGSGIGIRWDPIALDVPPAVPGASGDPVADAEPSAAAPGPSAAPSAAAPGPSAEPSAAPSAAPPAPSATSSTASAPPSVPAVRRGRPQVDVARPQASTVPLEVPARGTRPGGPPDPSPSGTPATAEASPDVAASPTAAASPDIAAPSPVVDAAGPPSAPPVVLISPEVPGAVVDIADVNVKGSSISAELTTPEAPGLYRLVVTLHDHDGVAFDAGTQDRIPAFTVRVMGELSAVISATDRLTVAPGAKVDLPVTIANTGHLAWDFNEPRQAATDTLAGPAPGEEYPELVGQWLRLDASGAPSQAVVARATIQPLPGTTEGAVLALTAPPEPGSYLLVLDVVTPLYGSLTAVGGPPMVVRVDVAPPDSEDSQGAGGLDPRGDPASSR